MDDILAGLFDLCGLRTPRHGYSAWLSRLTAAERARVEVIVDGVIAVADDVEATFAALDSAALEIAPILLARRV